MLVAENLARDYGETHALRGASIRVAPGEVVALLGPNGAGKSTLINILAGVLAPDRGKAGVDGVRIPGEERELPKHVGFVPQGESVYPELTVEENIRFFGGLQGIRGAKLKARVDALLKEVALDDRRRTPAGDLSGGLRQRLALACSMVHDPPVMLLDEPGTGLDPTARERLWTILRGMRARGRAVLLTTHSFEEAARVADRVVLLSRGAVAAEMAATERAKLEAAWRALEAHE